jgi:hypothetical protein
MDMLSFVPRETAATVSFAMSQSSLQMVSTEKGVKLTRDVRCGFSSYLRPSNGSILAGKVWSYLTEKASTYRQGAVVNFNLGHGSIPLSFPAHYDALRVLETRVVAYGGRSRCLVETIVAMKRLKQCYVWSYALRRHMKVQSVGR